MNWPLPGTGDYPDACNSCGAPFDAAAARLFAGGQGKTAGQIYSEARFGTALFLLAVLGLLVAAHMGCGLVRYRFVQEHAAETKAPVLETPEGR